MGMYLSTKKCWGEKIHSFIFSKIWENEQLHLGDAEITGTEDKMLLTKIKTFPLKSMESKLKIWDNLLLTLESTNLLANFNFTISLLS